MTHIRQTVARMDAAYPVEVKFYDQLLNSLYQREVRFGTILLCFSLLAVVLSLVGVFALVIFDIYYKRKEIALRKVFGAEFTDIIGLGLKPYFWLVCIAFCAGTSFFMVDGFRLVGQLCLPHIGYACCLYPDFYSDADPYGSACVCDVCYDSP